MVRQGAQVELLGKVAEVQPDGSLLQLGTQGVDDGKSFEIVGRIQLAYEDGYWNEWYLYYSDGTDGWIGEAMGEFFVSKSLGPQRNLPDAERLKPGTLISLAGASYAVTSRTESRLASFEGELPFLVEGSTPFVSVDLRSSDGGAATIDYSESPPLLFMGHYCSFEELKFTGLRTGQDVEAEVGGSVEAAGVTKLNCPTCGAPHSVVGGVRSKILGCEFCGSTIDLSDPRFSVLYREESTREQLRRGVDLEIGSKAEIDGAQYVLLGYLKKTVTYEGVHYPWVEYLLYNPERGYRWLECSDGHYTLMHNLDRLPARAGVPVEWPNTQPVEFEGRSYRHFQTARATVRGLGGEFYWRVKVGDSATNHVYVSPPYLLACETSPYGQVWVQGEYLEPEQVRRMFGLDRQLSPPVGVGPNQPNPHRQVAAESGKFAGFLLLIALVFTVLSPSTAKSLVYQTSGENYETFRPTETRESEPFRISGPGNLAFSFRASGLNNRWLHFQTELLDGSGKVVRSVGRSVERFHGQGSNAKTVRVRGVPNGEYRLRYRLSSGTSRLPDTPNEAQPSNRIPYSLEIRRGVPVWGWFWFFAFMLGVGPILFWARTSTFETKRWYNSDHG